MSTNGNKNGESGDVNSHHHQNNDNDDCDGLDNTDPTDSSTAPEPPVAFAEKQPSAAARLELATPTEATYRSERSVDCKVDPELKRVQRMPSEVAPYSPDRINELMSDYPTEGGGQPSNQALVDPPTLTGRDRPVDHTQHQQQEGGRPVTLPTDHQRVGPGHANGRGPSPGRGRTYNNNHALPDDTIPFAVAQIQIIDSELGSDATSDQPNESQRSKWFWIAVAIIVVAIATAITVPVSISLQNKAGESEPSIPAGPTAGTVAPVTAAPVTAAPVTSAPISPAPVTAAPITPAPVTAAPVTAGSVTAAPSSSSERLAALIQSRLPSVSFSNPAAPESRAFAWMTEVDTRNQDTLSDDQLIQRFAMAALGLSINGFSNWFTSQHECSWGSGQVGCNSLREVNQIVAEGVSLSGSIPVSMGLLTNMEWLKLNGNVLTGTIPSEVGNLQQLIVWDLRFNPLTGTIPSEVGRLTSLIRLDLNNNGLRGTIPSEIGGLVALTRLGLYDNRLSGTIPSEMGGLAALTWLGLWNNELTGTIPSEVGSISGLRFLYFNDNQLTGTIPSEVGDLTALTYLQLQRTQLSGTMPAGVCLRTVPLIDCGEIVCDCCC